MNKENKEKKVISTPLLRKQTKSVEIRKPQTTLLQSKSGSVVNNEETEKLRELKKFKHEKEQAERRLSSSSSTQLKKITPSTVTNITTTKSKELFNSNKEIKFETNYQSFVHSSVQLTNISQNKNLSSINFSDKTIENIIENVDNRLDSINEGSMPASNISKKSDLDITPIRRHSKIYESPSIKVSGKAQRILVSNIESDDAQEKINQEEEGLVTPTLSSPYATVIPRRRSKIYSSPAIKVSGKAQRVKVQMPDESEEGELESPSKPYSKYNPEGKLITELMTSQFNSRRNSKTCQSPTLKLSGKAQRVKLDSTLSEDDNDSPKKITLTSLNPRERSYSLTRNKFSESDQSNSTEMPHLYKRHTSPIFKFQGSGKSQQLTVDLNGTNDVSENSKVDVVLEKNNIYEKLNQSNQLETEKKIYTSLYSTPDNNNEKGKITTKNLLSQTVDLKESLTSMKVKKNELSLAVSPIRNQKTLSDTNLLIFDEQEICKLLEQNGFKYKPNLALHCEHNLSPLKRNSKKGDVKNSVEQGNQGSTMKTNRWESFTDVLGLGPGPKNL
ncbi:11571_t:CDS:2 [Diversispora eburnea]|uniref:11571_t:CDS:1 n=1 Tax=Diversispora eburnea TaxID=1213867 RepID=A0A9N9FMY6_9GLOM|nr:11571_t:CDS:2 [Diversispora eburnea]